MSKEFNERTKYFSLNWLLDIWRQQIISLHKKWKWCYPNMLCTFGYNVGVREILLVHWSQRLMQGLVNILTVKYLFWRFLRIWMYLRTLQKRYITRAIFDELDLILIIDNIFDKLPRYAGFNVCDSLITMPWKLLNFTRHNLVII